MTSREVHVGQQQCQRILCELSLEGSLSRAGRVPISPVIQGSGGRGKTKSVISAVKTLSNSFKQRLKMKCTDMVCWLQPEQTCLQLTLGGAHRSVVFSTEETAMQVVAAADK